MPSHYLNQCWNIVNWNLRNKVQWNIKQNSYIFMHENAFENVVSEMEAILSRPQCVNSANFQGGDTRILFPNRMLILVIYHHSLVRKFNHGSFYLWFSHSTISELWAALPDDRRLAWVRRQVFTRVSYGRYSSGFPISLTRCGWRKASNSWQLHGTPMVQGLADCFAWIDIMFKDWNAGWIKYNWIEFEM